MHRAVNRRRERDSGILALAIPLLMGLVACSGSQAAAETADAQATGADWSPDVIVPDPDTPVQPSLATMPMVVGRNRIAFGLVGQDGLLTSGAKVEARFYSLADTGDLMAERSLSAIDLPQGFAHRHADGTDHDHSGPTATVYAAEVEFDRPEWWGAELLVELDGEQLPPMKVPFRVEGDTPEPAFGERVPAIEQITTDDVDDLALIDSSDPPHPEWHDITVAEALELGRPLVIAFATGAFCQTQFCGPVIEGVIGPLAERYGDEAEFIVIEPFDLAAAWNGDLVPVPEMAQWGLDSEPWVFVTDADGRVAGKFQGITSVAEVGATLDAVLTG